MNARPSFALCIFYLQPLFFGQRQHIFIIDKIRINNEYVQKGVLLLHQHC